MVIAIDGYSATGKSTLARKLANALGYIFLDTGAMYRAVTHYFLSNRIDWNDPEQLDAALLHITIAFQRKSDGTTVTLLNGENVEEPIRGMEVANKVSEVAAVSAVRRFLVQQQRIIGGERNIVMDGRDIGTVVFPDAALKLFVTADFDVRVHRRWNELKESGTILSHDEVANNLRKRDREETERTDSPLLQAPDAIVMDTSKLSQDEMLEAALKLARERSVNQ